MRRGRIFIILGFILALGTAVVVFYLLQKGTTTGPTPAAEVKTQKVVIALQNISQGAPIIPEVIELRDYPVDAVPPEALTNTADAAGKLAKSDIYQGQVLQKSMLTDEEAIKQEGVNASFIIPKGKVAIAFPISLLSGVAYAIQPGDTVDVLVSLYIVDLDPETQVQLPVKREGVEGQIVGEQQPRLVTQLTLQNVEVLRVGPWQAEKLTEAQTQEQKKTQTKAEEQIPQTPTPEVVTLALNQQDALVLKFARESGMSIDLVLRARNDSQEVSTESVTLDYMLNRFNIATPPKKPFNLVVPAAPSR